MKNIISKNVSNIQISLIKQMPVLARKLVLEGKLKKNDIASLGQGIPSMPTPAYIRNFVIEKLKKDTAICQYSLQSGLPELKNAVAKRLEKISQRKIEEEFEVFISAGAMEALAIGIATIINDGDEVILADPSYASHIEQVLFAGGKPVFTQLNAQNNWGFNIADLARKITPKTKAMILCSPANPTGAVIDRKILAKIVKIALKNKIFIIADETYSYLTYDKKFISILEFPSIKNQLIYINSFSKEFAMTGWRVGYMHASKKIIDNALKAHDAFLICAPTISQYAALAALTKKVDKNQANMKAIYEKRRTLTCSLLDELADLFEYQKPQGAYYILARYKKTKLNSLAFAKKLLAETGVITIPGSAFGPGGEGYIRFSFCSEEAKIKKAFLKIKKWSEKL